MSFTPSVMFSYPYTECQYNDTKHNKNATSNNMQCYAKCRLCRVQCFFCYTECHYSECRRAECRGALSGSKKVSFRVTKPRMLFSKFLTTILRSLFELGYLAMGVSPTLKIVFLYLKDPSTKNDRKIVVRSFVGPA